jgi:hypothetical protein
VIWPGDIESVTVTWMDEQQATYPCSKVRTEDGVLKLATVYKGSIGFSDVIKNECEIPLANVRKYVINRAGLSP